MTGFDTYIRGLQRLLSALYLRELGKRIANYRQSTSDASEKELAGALNNLIDSLLANAAHSTQPEVHIDDVPSDNLSPKAPVKSSPARPHPAFLPTSPASDTSAERIRRATEERRNNSLGRKLWSSAVEHIHAAHRCALKGDSANANLHSNIAKEAIKDASHYLSDDEYEGFIARIRTRLPSLPG